MPKIRGLRWWMISLIMLGSIINYLARSTLAVAAPTVLKDLHITAQQYSWIVGAFQGAIMAGTRRYADFDYFVYQERGYRVDPFAGDFSPAS